jgi:hypothetical protein
LTAARFDDLSECRFRNGDQIQRCLGIEHLTDQVEPTQILGHTTDAVLLAILGDIVGKISLQNFVEPASRFVVDTLTPPIAKYKSFLA